MRHEQSENQTEIKLENLISSWDEGDWREAFKIKWCDEISETKSTKLQMLFISSRSINQLDLTDLKHWAKAKMRRGEKDTPSTTDDF